MTGEASHVPRDLASSSACPLNPGQPQKVVAVDVAAAWPTDHSGRSNGRGRAHDEGLSVRGFYVESPNMASRRVRSKPSSKRPRTSRMGTLSVGMPILAALACNSRAAAGSFSMSLYA